MWINAIVRDSSTGIPIGTKVLVRKSKVPHTSVGPCWWVFDGKAARQIAETFGGRDLYKAVVKKAPFSNQDLADERFLPFFRKFLKQRRLANTNSSQISPSTFAY